MDQFTLGQHDAAIQNLQADVRTLGESNLRIEATVNRIEIALAQKVGERKVATWVLTTVASVVGAAVTLVIKSWLHL